MPAASLGYAVCASSPVRKGWSDGRPCGRPSVRVAPAPAPARARALSREGNALVRDDGPVGLEAGQADGADPAGGRGRDDLEDVAPGALVEAQLGTPVTRPDDRHRPCL